MVIGELLELWLPLLLNRVARLFVFVLLSAFDMRRESLDIFRLKRDASLSPFSPVAGPEEGGLDKSQVQGESSDRFEGTGDVDDKRREVSVSVQDDGIEC